MHPARFHLRVAAGFLLPVVAMMMGADR